jgi:hypothetical protein
LIVDDLITDEAAASSPLKAADERTKLQIQLYAELKLSGSVERNTLSSSTVQFSLFVHPSSRVIGSFIL